ncbi:hypothetical protein SDC9_105139 [bioreactor metagenome]|uniref:Uncharacterized protein n=1 Tax=bioreactor metagenome TaxID=1076179 RepID=A0A645AZU1_9ZZZZ
MPLSAFVGKLFKRFQQFFYLLLRYEVKRGLRIVYSRFAQSDIYKMDLSGIIFVIGQVQREFWYLHRYRFSSLNGKISFPLHGQSARYINTNNFLSAPVDFINHFTCYTGYFPVKACPENGINNYLTIR